MKITASIFNRLMHIMVTVILRDYLMWVFTLHYAKPNEHQWCQSSDSSVLPSLAPLTTAVIIWSSYLKGMAGNMILFIFLDDAASVVITYVRAAFFLVTAMALGTAKRKENLNTRRLFMSNNDMSAQNPQPYGMVTWNLHQPPHTELVGPEVCFGYHKQTRVYQKHLELNKEYRSICKLFIDFQDGTSATGSGWLIDNNTVVTAAHCVRNVKTVAALIRVYVNYCGKASADDGRAVKRIGKRVVAHSGWDESPGNDIAFIRVTEPFTNVTPITVIDCPDKCEKVQIRLIGYPGNMPKDAPQEEKGDYMFESRGPITCDINDSSLKGERVMIHYQLDTAGGNSGSPVLIERNGILVAIGVHHGSSETGDTNVAAPFGHNGNTASAFFDAISDRDES